MSYTKKRIDSPRHFPLDFPFKQRMSTIDESRDRLDEPLELVLALRGLGSDKLEEGIDVLGLSCALVATVVDVGDLIHIFSPLDRCHLRLGRRRTMGRA